MKHLFYFPAHSLQRLVTALVLAVVVLSLLGTPASAAPLLQGTIHKVYISDVRDNQFVVSWTTDSPCTAAIKYGTTPDGIGWSTLPDSVNATTHYVVVNGLSASTTYYFDTESNGVVDNNLGAHYSSTTGPMIVEQPPNPRAVGGDVYYFGTTTPAPYVIAYLKVNHAGVESQLAAVRTDDATGMLGRWRYVLSNLRTANNSSHFLWQFGDTITVTAQGGQAGTGVLVATVPSGSALIGNITLNNVPTAITLRALTARADSIAWLPIGCILLGTAAMIVVGRRRR